MVLRLAETLEVPLRGRNELLLAAGFAPVFTERDLSDTSFDAVRHALDQVLAGYEPYPAIVVNRTWHVVASNTAAFMLAEGVAPHLLEAPLNVLRASLHPEGMSPRIRNLDQWSDHLLARLRHQALITGDEELVELEVELSALVHKMEVRPHRPIGEPPREIAVPLLLDSNKGPLALVTTIATFGTALDITLAELALEALLPADSATAEILRAYAADHARLS